MARVLRIEYEGAIYHVFSRGHRGDPIYGRSTKKKIKAVLNVKC